ncbi:Uncharacterised protein [Vibrio cholerae]|nr:Uncharacterised protein [Vibrio cholerae]CSB38197.1 Uncharacterised protein [Vibrio cholerae]CSB81308.1 Uncharacterised protein [Vibrio cholerae]CSC47740.1 Uncharacterised protein [Vibrio cholerae]
MVGQQQGIEVDEGCRNQHIAEKQQRHGKNSERKVSGNH